MAFKSGLTPQYILRKSLCRPAHCFSSWIQGKGYIGTPETDATYNKQRRRSAESEIENLGYAPSYAEPGYDQPLCGVLMANWNVFPSKVTDILERAGYSIEWWDEWTTCDDCGRALRTQPDGHGWTPSYEDGGGDCSTLCFKCSGKDERDATRQRCEDIVKHPGKFENEPAYVPYFWEQSLDGCFDIIDFTDSSNVHYCEISAEDARIFPELKASIGKFICLTESEQGFVYHEIADSARIAELEAKAEQEAEYDE